jgi:hypothetical protein
VKRQGIGRGRVVISAGAVAAVVGCFGAWWTLGGTVTARISGNAFDGVGALTFVAAVLLIALVLLPYATRSGESVLDRKLTYVLLAALGVGAFGLRVVEIHEFAGIGMPQHVPGLWITGAGLGLIAWGVAELLGERPRRDWH